MNRRHGIIDVMFWLASLVFVGDLYAGMFMMATRQGFSETTRPYFVWSLWVSVVLVLVLFYPVFSKSFREGERLRRMREWLRNAVSPSKWIN